MMRVVFVFGVLLAAALAQQPGVPTETYRVVHVHPHDPHAFTQGLVYLDGHLYESTGLNGRSSLREEDLTTGKVLREHKLQHQYFGEGLTDWGNTLLQLTWISHNVFVYDRASFRLLKTLRYNGEAWGLTHDDKYLILSDGSSFLRFLDPNTLAEVRRIRVVEGAGPPVDKLNELEYVHGEIYANIWETDDILRIDPANGKILGRISLNGIMDKKELHGEGAVLNGIAYDPATDRLFVTGKLWPKLFEIQVVHK